MNQPSVYLAGPIAGLSVGVASSWRYDFMWRLADCGIIGLDPMRAKPWLNGAKSVADAYPEHALGSAKGIMARDMLDVRRADMIYACLLGAEKVSIGTVMEIAVAWQCQKPILIAVEKDNIHNHAMLIEGTGAIIVDDPVQALATIKGILLP